MRSDPTLRLIAETVNYHRFGPDQRGVEHTCTCGWDDDMFSRHVAEEIVNVLETEGIIVARAAVK